MGFAVTVAEPDLQVLAETVPHIHNTVLLFTVGTGVGFFLVVGMLRILTGKKLRIFLLVFYGIVFLLAAFTDQNFLGIAFDAGGVTTGPMTVPFILALGVGTYYDLPAADFFSVESTFITAGMVQQIHLRGKTISAWTINRQQDAEKLLQLGVDDLITDKPEIIAPLLARTRHWTTVCSGCGIRFRSCLPPRTLKKRWRWRKPSRMLLRIPKRFWTKRKKIYTVIPGRLRAARYLHFHKHKKGAAAPCYLSLIHI